MDDGRFSTIDYVLLILILLLSLGIGLYSAIFKKQNSAKEYLHGGKNMNFIAVSLSIISSIISGVSLVSFPTEIYYYGSQTILLCLSVALAGVTTYFLILPVFFKLQLTSISYFEMRFDSKVKLFSSCLFAIQMIVYSPMVVYAPGLIVSQVTKINVHFITPIICAICIIYTVFGGIKAVIWTDALQTLIMLASTIAIVVIGIISMGGIQNVYNTNYNTGRLLAKFDIDPTTRDTFWNILAGGYVNFLGMYGFGQGTIQKYISLKDYKDANRTNIISTIGIMLVFLLCFLSGFVALAKYVYCDPISTLKIKNPDQILPYYIMDVGKPFPGLAGIFVAGVISAALSTLSAILNSLSATIFNDFLKNLLPRNIAKQHEATSLKIIAALLGILCVSLVYIIEHLGTLMPLFVSFLGLTNGPMAGLFLVGMLLPTVNSKGALIGGVTSLLFSAWLIFTAQWYKMNGMIKYPTLKVYTNGCAEHLNIIEKSVSSVINTTHDAPPVYKISHQWYPFIGVISVVVVSLVVSYFTDTDKYTVNEDCLSPVVASYIRRKQYQKSADYNRIDKTNSKSKNLK